MVIDLPPLAIGVAVATAAWWAATGLVLWLVRGPGHAVARAMWAGGMLAGLALIGLATSARDPSMAGSLLGFLCALTVWGWHELAFLTGRVTGPRRDEQPSNGWPRFRAAATAVMHHELALAATLVAVALLTWGGANPTGLLTFGVLFAMRLSTKFNIYLGVANPPLAFLPKGLEHLRVWFIRRPFNALMPLSLLGAAVVTWALAARAMDAATPSGLALGFALAAGMAGLGLIEHLFLTAPSPDRALWGWALERQARRPRA